ncbi:unnamed protein product [Phytophthora fragariaefolia]|uniref:Unnamed protein product n=1 Tax=Phytophthora fragariaefolia TaxID=1490495 RepID=A0A9W6XXL6_9STRA|nr:unnamed protein product [Phytophthora fragariaefolia]
MGRPHCADAKIRRPAPVHSPTLTLETTLAGIIAAGHFPPSKVLVPSTVMVFALSTVALFAAFVVAATSTAQGATVLGGYTQKNATSDDLDILVKAAGNASTYNDDVSARVCLIAVEGLQTQTVAGTNYKFQVAGCTVESDDGLGACDDRNCDYSSYSIVIYSQPWTDTLKVTSITPAE